eukprot:1167230-Rhodomonas_salina.1
MLGQGETARNSFMASVAGSTGAFVQDLGVTLEGSVVTAHPTGTAYFINPGYGWGGPGTTGTSVFTLSSEVILVALYSVEVGGSRRRSLLQTKRSPPSVSGAAVRFDVSPKSLVASVLRVPEGFVSSWRIVLQIGSKDACGPTEALMARSRSRLLSILANAKIDVQDLYVTSVRIDNGNADCFSRRSTGTASAALDVLIVDDDSATSQSSIGAALRSSPDVISTTSVGAKPDIDDTPSTNENDDPVSADANSGGPPLALIAMGIAAAFFCLAVGAVVWWHRTRHSSSDVRSLWATESVQIDKIRIECKLSDEQDAERQQAAVPAAVDVPALATLDAMPSSSSSNQLSV